MRVGIYQTILPHTVVEEHGGTYMRHEIHWNLCFYPNRSIVGLFGGDKHFLKPYLEESYEMKGEIVEMTDHYIKLFIVNPLTNFKEYYSGEIIDNSLHLTYYTEDKPSLVSKDVFKYIGTGEQTV